MKKISVLVHDWWKNKVFTDEHYAKLRTLGEVKIWDGKDVRQYEYFSDREYLLSFIEGSDLLLTTWYAPPIGQEIIDACKNLKGVIHAAGSVKPLITPALLQSDIVVSTANDELACGVAETTLGIAIAACKRMFMFPYECRKGLWRDNFNKITDFYGIKIGIIGAGAVGRHFIRLLKNFHVDIFVYDPYMTEKQIFELGAKKCELSYLLKESDVISLHAPLLPSTEKMINRENLKLIKDGAVLINTSRGKLIDEIALIEECKKERFTVVLDVTYPEPPAKDSPLRSLPNVFLLPHIGGVTTNGDARLGNFACEEASRFFSGEELIGKVDLSKLSVLA